MSISISDLPVVDDLDVPVSADEYVDQATGPTMVLPGNYAGVVTKHKVQTKKDGSILLVDDKFPVIVIEQVKIIEPTENERLVNVFTDVRTKPFKRKGPQGQEVVASDLQDLLRSYDATQGFEGFAHMTQLLDEYFQSSKPFYFGIGYTGYDKDYVEQEKKKFTADTPKDVVNAMYAKARLATKNFVVNNVLQTSVVNPASGNTIEARARITRFYPSTVEVVTGKAGKNQIVLGPFKK